MACGHAGMSERDFWDCELKEVFNRITGYQQREQGRIRHDWEQTRWLASIVLSMFAKKGQAIKPTDLVRFPWDEAGKEKEAPRPLTDEERRQRFGRLDAKILKMMQQHEKKSSGETGP